MRTTFMKSYGEPDTLEALGLEPLRVGVLVDALQHQQGVHQRVYLFFEKYRGPWGGKQNSADAT
jgi:hypothetical protein